MGATADGFDPLSIYTGFYWSLLSLPQAHWIAIAVDSGEKSTKCFHYHRHIPYMRSYGVVYGSDTDILSTSPIQHKVHDSSVIGM